MAVCASTSLFVSQPPSLAAQHRPFPRWLVIFQRGMLILRPNQTSSGCLSRLPVKACHLLLAPPAGASTSSAARCSAGTCLWASDYARPVIRHPYCLPCNTATCIPSAAAPLLGLYQTVANSVACGSRCLQVSAGEHPVEKKTVHLQHWCQTSSHTLSIAAT